jgi:hypothetical protein
VKRISHLVSERQAQTRLGVEITSFRPKDPEGGLMWRKLASNKQQLLYDAFVDHPPVDRFSFRLRQNV